jgi:hypothetical protein
MIEKRCWRIEKKQNGCVVAWVRWLTHTGSPCAALRAEIGGRLEA